MDHWTPEKWSQELRSASVFVFIHDVFLLVLSRGHLAMADLALLIIDECHHAVGNHAYSRIMEQHYHQAKRQGLPVPKVLGLSASLVIRSVKVAQFRAEKAQLERTLDATVETAEELGLAKFVTSARERIVTFPRSPPALCRERIEEIVVKVKMELADIKNSAAAVINASNFDTNSKQTSLDSLKKDYKFFSNDVFGAVSALFELGLYSVHRMERPLQDQLRRKALQPSGDWYDPAVAAALGAVSQRRLQQVAALAELEMLDTNEAEEQKILQHSSAKVKALVQELQTGATGGLMRCIVFVERKLVAQALACLLGSLAIQGVRGVDWAYSANRGSNVKDPQERLEVQSIKRKLRGTLTKFRKGEVNVLVSTSVVEEGLDIPSCNLVIKFDFPTTYRSYIQSKGRARKEGSLYLLLVEEGDQGKEADYQEWRGVYRMSMEECHARRSRVEVEESQEEFYSTKMARVSGTQAQVR